jgi:hypothetical protein
MRVESGPSHQTLGGGVGGVGLAAVQAAANVSASRSSRSTSPTTNSSARCWRGRTQASAVVSNNQMEFEHILSIGDLRSGDVLPPHNRSCRLNAASSVRNAQKV